MTPFDIGLIALVVMIFLVLAGLYIPVALMITSFGGVWAIKGSSGLAIKLMALAANDAIASYFFGIVPLFVLMGFIVAETGMGQDAYSVANAAFRRIKGGLGVGTVAANAIFAAITGISIASAAVFTKIAVPEMIRHGYSPRFATGVVAGSSVLGMLIPPSLLYAILTEQSVGDMFVAGIIPGLLLSVLFVVGILITAYLAPHKLGNISYAGAGEVRAGELVLKGLPIVALIVIVLGGIYTGFFTPVEAGAIGAIFALLFGALTGKLTMRKLLRILIDTGLVTATICLLIIAAQMYSRMLAFSGLPAGLAEFTSTADLGFWGLMLVYVGVLISMGMILDSSSILLIMVPIMVPVVAPMDINLVWFGIVTIVAVEIGLLTPPFGISVYVIKATLDDDSITLVDIFRGAFPFAVLMMVLVALLLFFPILATGLL